uniref:Uncharacterized protein n=1 Tax=Anopheles dirus TaxID=7168 RepID=A0A182NPH6_9DIPT
MIARKNAVCGAASSRSGSCSSASSASNSSSGSSSNQVDSGRCAPGRKDRCACAVGGSGLYDSGRVCRTDSSPGGCGALPVASAVLLLEDTRTTGCYPFGLKLSQAIPCYATTNAFRGKLTFPLATEWLV